MFGKHATADLNQTREAAGDIRKYLKYQQTNIDIRLG